MDLTTIKTFGVFAIIFGCFALLYPKIVHPMILHLMGEVPQSDYDINDPSIRSKLPPHIRNVLDKEQSGPEDNFPPHFKHGGLPHPGMRAAAEMKKQARTKQQSVGGRGMMGVVLPMYAVGIVIYLIYTLAKVFGRRVGSNGASDDSAASLSVSRWTDPASDQDDQMARRIAGKQKELEKLLLKADKEDINDGEMTELRKRLLETESQMTKILEAMQSVQNKVTKTFENKQDIIADSESCATKSQLEDDEADVLQSSDDNLDEEAQVEMIFQDNEDSLKDLRRRKKKVSLETDMLSQ